MSKEHVFTIEISEENKMIWIGTENATGAKYHIENTADIGDAIKKYLETYYPDVINKIQGDNKIEKDRYEIFREVQHEFFVMDAVNHVDDYLEARGIDPTKFTGKFDYDYLAEVFSENHDCNVADNLLWEDIIQAYVNANKDEGCDSFLEIE